VNPVGRQADKKDDEPGQPSELRSLRTSFCTGPIPASVSPTSSVIAGSDRRLSTIAGCCHVAFAAAGIAFSVVLMIAAKMMSKIMNMFPARVPLPDNIKWYLFTVMPGIRREIISNIATTETTFVWT
jgi:hypothetical protein